jgi:FAD-dependent urate hydroxylase
VRATEALIIGAGPYGLSISTHLRGRGIEHLVVGRPMNTWRAHMPTGMYLKSEPYGSDMSSPEAGYDIAGYCRSEGIDGVGRGTPLPIGQFLEYCDWYIKHLVPDITDATVTEITPADGRFHVAFADAEPVAARSVVVATGVLPHVYMPAELSGLSREHVSHTCEHHQFDDFRERRVAVLGAGSSALETAALLHEAGSEVHLVVRSAQPPVWGSRALPLNAVTRLRDNKLCEGWKCPFWDSPAAFRLLPKDVRVVKARTVLGPLGAWWLKDRVDGVVEILGAAKVRSAQAVGSGVRLELDGPGPDTLTVDHVIAGTGYRYDLARLTYLPEGLQARVATRAGYPVLTLAGQSTVPGLYFAGALAAFGLGPSMRFIAGTHNLAGRLARSVARRANEQATRAHTDRPDRISETV